MAAAHQRHVYSTNKGNVVRLPTSDTTMPSHNRFSNLVALNPYEEVSRITRLTGSGGEGNPPNQHVTGMHGYTNVLTMPNVASSPATRGRRFQFCHSPNSPYEYSSQKATAMFQYPQTALHYNTPNAAAVSPYAPGSPTSAQQYRGNEVAARLYSSSGSPTNYPPPNKHTTASLVMNSGTLQNYDVRHMNSPNYERSGPVGPQTTESSIYSSAIPTANLIHTPEAVTLSTQQLLNDICSTPPGDNATIMQQEDCENDYPHLALDLTKVKNQFGQPVIPGKQKSREKSSSTIAREGNLANRVSSGKPLHPYTAMFNDPVEKELERWHNMHNSTVKWQRVKRGVYTADGQEVLLVKLNGCLYVKGFNPNNKLDHTAIDNFVQSMQGGNNI